MAKITRSNPQVFATLNARLKEMDGLEAKVGWLNSSVYESGIPVATVASIHEFGAPSKNIPPRPMLRPTIDREWNNWKDLMGLGAKAALEGRINMRDAMGRIAAKAAGDVQRTITQIFSPPLKEATIKARLRRRVNKEMTQTLAKPLVDTGKMLADVTFQVEGKP